MEKPDKLDGKELEENRFQSERELHERVADEVLAERGGDEEASRRRQQDEVKDTQAES